MMFTLASTSQIRRHILSQAGLVFEAVSPGVDEEAVKAGMRLEKASPRAQADKLAELKATKISAKRGGFVLGCDQILALDGVAFDKADTLEEARDRLRAFSGKTHQLECAAVIAQDGVPIWRIVKTPKLTMRPLSEAFIADYLEKWGTDALSSVGCYQLEGAGAQLFSKIEGDYFSILGIPLLEVMDFLRLHGKLAA